MHDDGEIRTLLALVSQLGDTGESDEYLALFTEDATTTMVGNTERGIPGTTNTGRIEIARALAERRGSGMLGPGSDTRHALTTTAITFDGPDRATADSVYQFYMTTSTAPTLLGVGTYHDVVVRTELGWKMAGRTITIG